MRQISEFIEESCDGVLLCYDNEIQFSGFVIVENIEDVRVKVKDFIINKAKENIKEKINWYRRWWCAWSVRFFLK